MATRTDAKSRVLSRREIEAQIANGRSIVIVDNKVLKVDAWLPYHPGGDKAIRHMVGRDATDEVVRYVFFSATRKRRVLTKSVQFSLDTNTRVYASLPDRSNRGTMDQFPATDTRRKVQDTRRAQ